MLLSLMLAILAATTPGGAIEVTIRGTNAPLVAELLLRDAGDDWTAIAQKNLPATTRTVRFDGLASGIYQLRVRGPQSTEQLGMKFAVGSSDMRRATVTVEPFVLTGRVTLGGTKLGAGAIVLRHRELHWSARIALAPDGTFRAPLWQRATFNYHVDSPALPTDYSFHAKLDGTAPLTIDIPDGRITGFVRDAASGEPLADAVVGLQTNVDDREEHVKLITGSDGRFDFAGIKFGRQTLRVFPLQHLEPEPIAFTLDANQRKQNLDVRVAAGRSVPLIVIDHNDDPVAKAVVLAATEAEVRARTFTDEDGRATVAVPPGEPATLFVIPEEGLFAIHRLPPKHEQGRLKIYLPRAPSSLLIRATTTTGGTMPPFSLLMRYNGELVPMEVAEALTVVQGLQLHTGHASEAHLRNIPSGSYEFWPYRTDTEAESIITAASTTLAPIQVDVRTGENKIAVKFAAR